MDPNDMFRNFFGFRRPNNYRNREDDEFQNSFRGMDGMFFHFHNEMRKQMDEINEQMEDMFENFGHIEFSPDYLAPAIDENPRNNMLKEPDIPSDVPALPKSDRYHNPNTFGGLFSTPPWETFRRGHRRDTDLDEEVDERSIHRLLDEPRVQESDGSRDSRPQIFSSSKSFSMSRIKGADGKMEERRNVRHPDGSDEVIVTRRYGDKSHTVVTKTDKHGRQETHESLNNMDNADLPTFQKQWNETNSRDDLRLPQPSYSRDELVPYEEEDRSLFNRFFGFRPRFRD